MESLKRLLDRWAGHAVIALPLLPAALFALLPKWMVLRDEGFLAAMRATRTTLPGERWEESLGWIDRAAFFDQDLLLNFLLLPAAVIALAGLLPPRGRAPLAGLVGVALTLFVFVDMLSYSNVGRFLSFSMLLDAGRWGLTNPQYVADYVSLSSVVKLSALLASVVALALWAHRQNKAPAPTVALRIPLLAVFCLPAATACTAAYTTFPTTSFHQPVLQQMAVSLVGDRADTLALDRLQPEELKALFERESGTPPAPRDPRYFGRARGNDLLVFVFETGPSRALDITGDLADFPNLRRLRRHALVGAAHHSTYPYTSRAIYSILSGSYPIDALDTYFSAARPPAVPGWPRALAAEGYVTASYAPGRSQFTPDSAMLRALGIGQEHISDSTRLRSGGPWEQTLELDRAALQQLLRDMERWLVEDRRYAALFMPQAGHGPWHDLHGAGADFPARGRALMALQDQWLGEILAVLKRHGRLERTVILVTADHGVRTRGEDPQFSAGMVDAYSFHVPLLLWAPAAFPTRVTVRDITSHIDLAPTLLDLFGSDASRLAFQGMRLWDPGVRDRRTYFLGKGYMGADGMHRAGRFYMTNHLFHSAYASSRLGFSDADILAAESAEAEELFREMERMDAIRTSWINHLVAATRADPRH